MINSYAALHSRPPCCRNCPRNAKPTPPARADILWQKFTIGFFKLAAAATVIYYAVAVVWR